MCWSDIKFESKIDLKSIFIVIWSNFDLFNASRIVANGERWLLCEKYNNVVDSITGIDQDLKILKRRVRVEALVTDVLLELADPVVFRDYQLLIQTLRVCHMISDRTIYVRIMVPIPDKMEFTIHRVYLLPQTIGQITTVLDA